MQIHSVLYTINSFVVYLSSHRWYNKNITRGEAEDLLMKQVMSVFKDPVIIPFSFVCASERVLTEQNAPNNSSADN